MFSTVALAATLLATLLLGRLALAHRLNLPAQVRGLLVKGWPV